jgi:hypothetical protein
MNVVFLSPHFPPNFYTFCVRLRQAGANVLGLGDATFESLRPELRQSLSEYYRVADMHNYDELVRALGHFTHKHGKLHRLDSLNEYWLETEAYLRTDFNIFGFQVADIQGIKRKSEMKRYFREAGLPVARGKVCRTPDETWAFIREIGYPVVAKPDSGVGAAKTYKLHDDWEVKRYLVDKLPVEYILEEFISGTIVTYDGLTDINGNIVFAASHRYSRGVMETVNDGGDIYYYSERVIPPALEQAGKAVAKAFNLRERFFHFEFFEQTNGTIVALEVNMRPPGGLTVDMFNYANNIDIYKEWANVLTKGRFEGNADRPYFCAYIGRKYHRNYAHSHQQVLDRYPHLIAHSETINPIFAAAIGDFGYILRSPTLDPIKEAAAWIHHPG